MDIQEKEVLIAEIERFKEEALKMHIVQVLAHTYTITSLFDYSIDSDGSVIWYKAQACQLWDFWQAAKAQAVQEWISTEDQMPPIDETVLVCWEYAPDIEPEKEYTTIDENLDEYWPNCQDEPPTHWMPLPKVIKAQEPTND